MLNHSLPSLAIMKKRHAHLFGSDLCPLCSSKETDIHIFQQCEAYSHIRLDYSLLPHSILAARGVTINSTISAWLNNLSHLHPNGLAQDAIDLLAGKIPLEVAVQIAASLNAHEEAALIQSVSSAIINTSYRIWLARNEVIRSYQLTFQDRSARLLARMQSEQDISLWLASGSTLEADDYDPPLPAQGSPAFAHLLAQLSSSPHPSL